MAHSLIVCGQRWVGLIFSTEKRKSVGSQYPTLQDGWGGRIRTGDQRINSPLRYRCATPQSLSVQYRPFVSFGGPFVQCDFYGLKKSELVDSSRQRTMTITLPEDQMDKHPGHIIDNILRLLTLEELGELVSTKKKVQNCPFDGNSVGAGLGKMGRT